MTTLASALAAAVDVWSPAATVQLIATAGTVLAALVTAAVPVWRRLGRLDRRQASQTATLEEQTAALEETRTAAHEARVQVKNDHGTNLRHDLDAVHEDIRTLEQYAAENRESARIARELGAANHQAIGAVAVELRRVVELLEQGPHHRPERRPRFRLYR